MLARVDAITVDIGELDARIEEQIAPFADAVTRLDAIPGVGATAAKSLFRLSRITSDNGPNRV